MKICRHSVFSWELTTTHICVYTALFQLWNEHDFQNSVLVTRQKTMESGKISGIATYHKAMKDLHDFGCIGYQPSRNSAVMSKEFLGPFTGLAQFGRQLDENCH